MEIYLPVAQMSVHWLLLLGLGGGIGFISGLLGVGGGFLLTPLLIFIGIPPTIAVATTSSHVTASSMSGALAQWRKGAIDLKMAAVMTGGGVAGTAVGVWLLSLLRRAGQTDLIVSGAYVILLGAIGSMMLRESLTSLRAARSGAASTARRIGHNWIQRLPLKDRFPASRLYISLLAPIGIGFVVGVLSAVMGIGGGFLIVPAMIYGLRMPTNMVMGTSLAQIIAITAAATVLQSIGNHAVDAMLAVFLVVGGVLGAQLGVRASSRLRGEQLRFLLAVVILTVGAMLLYGLIARPADLFSVMVGPA